ncbi:CHAT domain-containing protein [Suillus bovinus]|uniref:CHAT domain-containing protein n=1 Tax=Suillus bovinus TaxID=48563 RepID=UPI001B86D98E|nr:CHAT domain-containing protein [Suillus bovinus]KAG2139825.1 CHAT domain-containing protein [Suillus bovinus]
MSGSSETRYIRLEVISGKNLQVPSGRIPAGIYISVKVDSRRCWKSAISVLSSGESVAWGNTVTLSSHTSPTLSLAIRASYELGRMLGSGEVIGELEMSWDDLLDYGDEPFNLPFPPMPDVQPSIALKVAVVHTCDDQNGALSDHHRDINSTICLFRDALALRPQCHPDHPLSLYNLIEALTWRHNKKGTAADISEAAQLYHELLPLCPEGTYLRSIAAGENGVDYVINGCNNLPTDASDEGIHLRRVVLELCPSGHQLRPSALDELAQAHGSTDDVDTSIQLCREAVSLCPEGHVGRDAYLNNLAAFLMSRFNHQGKPNDLDESISLHEEVLRLCPVGHIYRGALLTPSSLYREALKLRPLGHPYRDTTLSNLALALQTRYDNSHVGEEINDAIDQYRECLRLQQLDHPTRHRTLFNLSSALCSRFTQTQKNKDVEEAITLCQESLAGLSSLHPDRYFSYMWLQEAYLSRYRILHDAVDLSLAVENFRLASRHPTQGFPGRIITTYNWTVAAEKHGHGSAIEAYSTFFELMDAHLATAISGNFTGAKLLLPSKISDHCHAAADRAATEYRRLTRQWEGAVAEIRDLRAFSRFLLPPLYEDLQAAARQGPVIILIARGPHHVPLPSVTLDRFARAIRHASTLGSKVPRNDLIVLLRTVWDEIVLPIVNVLQRVLKLKFLSRIWLCPTAAFTSIPLHAAHPFRTNPDRSREPCLEDLYICSYTPTLSALVGSRQLMKKRVTPSFVTIGQGQPGAGKGKALLAVESELELVHKLVPAGANHTTISRDAATRAGALEALQQNTWVHLACHGKQDPAQPYNSHFVMRDEDLTLLDIMERDIPHAEFAFLSACHTAVGDEETPDEVIHLAAGLQFSGFKSVIGTLWQVDDAVAKYVVEAFYTSMFEHLKDGGVMDCTKAAWALNRATHTVKTKVPLEQRMVFIHIGV